MKTLGVALCITDLDVGGAERSLVELASRLDRQRFHPVVYCLSPRPKADGPSVVPSLEAAGIEVHFLAGRGNRDLLRVVGRLTKLLAVQSPQILQSFLFHANIVGRLAAHRAGIDCVVSAIRVAERQHRWHLWIDRLTHRMVDRHVCVSQSVAQFTEHRGKLPPERLIVIPNGVDVARYPAANHADLTLLGVEAGRRVVTCVARLERQKGVAWLIETAGAWMGRLPDCDLLLVGKGPEQAKLARLSRLSGIADRVHFAGWRDDVPEILAASDLLVLPSIWEGMPNVVLEAMASRRPVVATAVEGVAEMLGPAADEQTVPYGDSQALTEKVVTLMENPEIRERFGRENRRRVEENFTLERMVNAYEDLWESLVAG